MSINKTDIQINGLDILQNNSFKRPSKLLLLGFVVSLIIFAISFSFVRLNEGMKFFKWTLWMISFFSADCFLAVYIVKMFDYINAKKEIGYLNNNTVREITCIINPCGTPDVYLNGKSGFLSRFVQKIEFSNETKTVLDYTTQTITISLK